MNTTGSVDDHAGLETMPAEVGPSRQRTLASRNRLALVIHHVPHDPIPSSNADPVVGNPGGHLAPAREDRTEVLSLLDLQILPWFSLHPRIQAQGSQQRTLCPPNRTEPSSHAFRRIKHRCNHGLVHHVDHPGLACRLFRSCRAMRSLLPYVPILS